MGSCDWCTWHGQEEHPTSEIRGRSWEDPLPEGRQPRGVTPRPRSGAAAGRNYPASEVRGSGPEDLSHTGGQGPRLGGAIPPPRSGGCVRTGGPRGAIPRSGSEGAVVRRYPSSKVRSSGFALLEQP